MYSHKDDRRSVVAKMKSAHKSAADWVTNAIRRRLELADVSRLYNRAYNFTRWMESCVSRPHNSTFFPRAL